MEELRSTEILDKEIEADARKKVKKILKNADSECERILADVENRVKDASEQKSKYYKSKIEQFEKNVNAALPLEKERFLVKFYADSVSSSLNDYLKKIGSEKRLSLIEKSLEKKLEVTSGKKFNALVFGIPLDSAKKLLESKKIDVGSVSEVTFETSGEECALGNEIHEGMIIESEDKVLRLRLTIDQILREIEDKYSEELALSLFGGKLPQ
jgi:V/A-type H+-transporting ATPase subunit E